MKPSVKFTKMHALGNDFMVIDGVQQHVSLKKAQIKAWADRRRGIGFDQLLLIEPSDILGADFLYRIFNADGSEVGQCGNGARAIAKFVQLKKLSNKNKIIFKTKNSFIECVIEKNIIKANLGIPKFAPQDVPIHLFPKKFIYIQNTNFGETIKFYALNIGNPHVIIFVDKIEKAAVDQLGKFFATHSMFPESTNVEFVQILQSNRIAVRVFERGVGETACCGSGACAAAIAQQIHYHTTQKKWLSSEIDVDMPGGTVQVIWQGLHQPVWLRGDVVTVFSGEITT